MLGTLSGDDSAELYVFVQLLAKAGCERRVEQALLRVLEASRDEPGCRGIHGFRAVHNDRLFYVQSIWQDEAAFTRHAALPHTVTFLDEVSALVAHPVHAIRTRLLG
jgi:quinol monooxygenase YgiN